MHDTAQVFKEAADFHRQGNLAEAERLYCTIVDAQPDHFDALHMLGVLRCQQGRFSEALALIGRALRMNSAFAPAHLNQGLALQALKRREEALASFDAALALAPDYAEAYYNRGVVLRGLNRPAEALASFDKALAIRPHYIEAINNRGNALRDLDRPLEALASYDAVLALQPRNAPVLNNRGNALRKLSRHAEALASYDKALAIEENFADALINRGMALLALNRPAQALASFSKVLTRDPSHARALAHNGNTLQVLHRLPEALACYDRLLALKPDHADAHYNRGLVLRDLHRLPEALAAFDAALTLRGDDTDTLNNRGLVLRDLERAGEALASFEKALAIAPNNAETHVNCSSLRLLTGDYAEGWKEFEWRWRAGDIARWRRDFPQPLWLGEQTLAGKTILLHAEQGFGDAIQFVRYVSLVAAASTRVILEVPQPLKDLFASVRGASRVIVQGDAGGDFDFHCPLLSLPLAFRTTFETIPAEVPYLSAPQTRMMKWRQALAPRSRPRVGVVWAGNPMFRNDQTRSVGLSAFLPLLSTAGIDFYSMQKDLREGDRERLATCPGLVHLGDQLADFADTAAVIESLDLVISSDTSVAHLAGALGKPTWILLQRIGDWRWLIGREDSPWYPSVRLFRQTEIGRWDSVISRVRDELGRWIDAASARAR
jgi:tetratricopeptide (TPR) repeat protein